jgi:hypothetical protein
MGRHARGAQNRDAQAPRRDLGRSQGQAVSRPAPDTSASLPVGNSVPVQRQEALPERSPTLPEEGRSGGLRVSPQARSGEHGENDRVQFSVTDADGREKVWALSGVDRASRAAPS